MPFKILGPCSTHGSSRAAALCPRHPLPDLRLISSARLDRACGCSIVAALATNCTNVGERGQARRRRGEEKEEIGGRKGNRANKARTPGGEAHAASRGKANAEHAEQAVEHSCGGRGTDANTAHAPTRLLLHSGVMSRSERKGLLLLLLCSEFPYNSDLELELPHPFEGGVSVSQSGTATDILLAFFLICFTHCGHAYRQCPGSQNTATNTATSLASLTIARARAHTHTHTLPSQPLPLCSVGAQAFFSPSVCLSVSLSRARAPTIRSHAHMPVNNQAPCCRRYRWHPAQGPTRLRRTRKGCLA